MASFGSSDIAHSLPSYLLQSYRSTLPESISYDPSSNLLPLVSEFASTENIEGFEAVQCDPSSFAGALPANQGLYSGNNEKGSCGVGFICHIKGEPSHKIVSYARQLVCAMTHQGATRADSRDGDSAGVMTAIPHNLSRQTRKAHSERRCPEKSRPSWGKYKRHDT